MKELINHPENIAALVMLLSFGTPVLMLVIKWFWKVTRKEVKSEVVNELREDNRAFKELIHEQMGVVKETVEVIKFDGKLRQKQHEDLMSIMMVHIDELGHVKEKVESNTVRIYKIEKQNN